MDIPYIDLKSQFKTLSPLIKKRINKVLEHGQYIMGPEVDELEKKLANFTGSKHCITVGSGTPAVTASVNVTSVSDDGTGDFTITIATDYANANYAVSATTFDDDGTNRNIGELTVNTQAADTILVKSFRPSASENSARGSFDPDGFYVISNAQ